MQNNTNEYNDLLKIYNFLCKIYEMFLKLNGDASI